MKERLTSRNLFHLTIVLIILIALVIYRTWFNENGSLTSGTTNDQICDLSRSPCPLKIGDIAIMATVSPQPILAEHDFTVIIKADTHQGITPIKAWLEGQEMFMGRIPVQLHANANGWQATSTMGSCHTEKMIWLLKIQWSDGTLHSLPLSVHHS